VYISHGNKGFKAIDSGADGGDRPVSILERFIFTHFLLARQVSTLNDVWRS
jgi:hypothetical protein